MADELLPCPWCGEAMMERHALWPSDGDTDAIIHAKPTECPLTGFSLGTSDEGSSVRAAWNTRAPVEAAKPAAGWMPISEAPRLRSVDLLLANAHTGEVAQGYWDTYATSLTAGAGFFDYSGEVFTPWAKQPTHFMPLPAAPEPMP